MQSLFTPCTVGSIELSNRIVMPPMTTRYADSEGYVTPQTVAYYAERARGGMGLIIFEATYPCEPHPDRHLLIDDSYIEGLASVTDAVHEGGSQIAAQLNISRGATDKHDPVVPSLSAVDTELLPLPVDHLRELMTTEIETLIQDCADGAVRAQQAGFDAVEIHAASGYLLHLFFSPVTNHRTDRYGGSLEDRTRIAREVIESIHARTSKEFPVWFRISGDEFMPGGIDEQEAAAIANELEGAGSAAVHVTAGHNWNRDASMGLLTAYEDRGLYTGLAAAVRTEVDVPVITVGRINDPVIADDIITAGDADLVAMGRAHIADPHFARKAEAGDLEKIRRCVGGLEGCRDMSLGGNQGITCTVNPRTGHETQEDITPVDDAKDITIIGGGPAGMEAARVAARRGHSVTLFERDQQLGGGN